MNGPSSKAFERTRVPAWYVNEITGFLAASADQVLGELARGSHFPVDLTQRDAWLQEIAVLRDALAGFDGWLFLEFEVPRLGSRVDAVVVTSSAVIPIEFKTGSDDFPRADYDQAWDYGLDLKNFHAASHLASIFPVLCATDAPDGDRIWEAPHSDGVRPPRRCTPSGLRAAIESAKEQAVGPVVDGAAWGMARYQTSMKWKIASRASALVAKRRA